MHKFIIKNRVLILILPIFILFSFLSGFRPTKDFSIDTPSYISFFETYCSLSYNMIDKITSK